jgi:hypothetical protein
MIESDGTMGGTMGTVPVVTLNIMTRRTVPIEHIKGKSHCFQILKQWLFPVIGISYLISFQKLRSHNYF